MKQIKRIWKHSHEDLPSVEVDSQGRRCITKYKEPPFRYMVAYEQEGDIFVAEVLAIDELDAVKQFLQEE
jgi:hypothetical protein